MAAGRESPFYRGPGGVPAEGVPAVPAARLDSLDADELRVYSKAAFAADARARGFGAPIWQ